MDLKIYDLDGTVICSKHRHATKEDGSLDLDYWRENSTPQKIFQDTLLPLVNQLRHDYGMSKRIVICTARVMTRADYAFLLQNNIPFDWIISRPKTCCLPDAEHKRIRLQRLFDRLKINPRHVSIYDDNESVLAMARKMGMRCYDAKKLNYGRWE